jgi:putative addiction module killer protein
MTTVDVQQYVTTDGRIPFREWMQRLGDVNAQARIAARIDRMAAGLRGDWKSVGGGVFELRVDYGPGYRVYCGQVGTTLVLLLLGGDKRTQQQDIEAAHGYWQDYKTRQG